MSTPRLIARRYSDHAHSTPVAEVSLCYEDRFLRRKVVTTTGGDRLLIDLPQTTSLAHGSVLFLESGAAVAVAAAPEALTEIRGDHLIRLAWHIGNRHAPCQIEVDRLLIKPDHVLSDMLAKLGAKTRDVVEPFTPEGGAYGHGRTHAHAH